MAETDGLRRIVIVTDAGTLGYATRKNPAPMGAGIILTTDGERMECAIPTGRGTSQQAELFAIKIALQLIRDRPNTCVTVVTDSRYCCGVLMPSDWKLKHNVELITFVRKLINQCRSFRMKWVKGHDDHKENERADFLASVACGKVPCPENVRYMLPEDYHYWLRPIFPSEKRDDEPR